MNCIRCYKPLKDNYESINGGFVHRECYLKIIEEQEEKERNGFKQFKIYFDDNTPPILLDYNEHNLEKVSNQLQRIKNKRLYIFGINFQRVEKVEVV